MDCQNFKKYLLSILYSACVNYRTPFYFCEVKLQKTLAPQNTDRDNNIALVSEKEKELLQYS